jgi:hypothetical protein
VVVRRDQEEEYASSTDCQEEEKQRKKNKNPEDYYDILERMQNATIDITLVDGLVLEMSGACHRRSRPRGWATCSGSWVRKTCQVDGSSTGRSGKAIGSVPHPCHSVSFRPEPARTTRRSGYEQRAFFVCLCLEAKFTERARYQWSYAIVYLPLTLWPTWKISSDPTFGGFEAVPCAGKI